MVQRKGPERRPYLDTAGQCVGLPQRRGQRFPVHFHIQSDKRTGDRQCRDHERPIGGVQPHIGPADRNADEQDADRRLRPGLPEEERSPRDDHGPQRQVDPARVEEEGEDGERTDRTGEILRGSTPRHAPTSVLSPTSTVWWIAAGVTKIET